jgi:hypothetical protein
MWASCCAKRSPSAIRITGWKVRALFGHADPGRADRGRTAAALHDLPEGNFIEASFDTPFFQIGETKYGRPILIRGYDRTMGFEDAVKLMMVSFDSTLKANLRWGCRWICW